MMERISAVFCLFWVIGRSFFWRRGRDQVRRVGGRREAYAERKEVMFSRIANSSVGWLEGRVLLGGGT
jgi:hypothetical protein